MTQKTKDVLPVDHDTGEVLEQGVYFVDGLPVYDKCNLIGNDHLGYDEYKNVIIVHEQPDDLWKLMDIEAQGTGLKAVIDIVTRSGQPLSVLDYDDKSCGDTTMLPDNVNDQFQLSKKLKSDFDALPGEITQGKTLSQFLELLGNQDVLEFIKKQTENKEKETLANEQKQD